MFVALLEAGVAPVARFVVQPLQVGVPEHAATLSLEGRVAGFPDERRELAAADLEAATAKAAPSLTSWRGVSNSDSARSLVEPIR